MSALIPANQAKNPVNTRSHGLSRQRCSKTYDDLWFIYPLWINIMLNVSWKRQVREMSAFHGGKHADFLIDTALRLVVRSASVESSAD